MSKAATPRVKTEAELFDELVEHGVVKIEVPADWDSNDPGYDIAKARMADGSIKYPTESFMTPPHGLPYEIWDAVSVLARKRAEWLNPRLTEKMWHILPGRLTFDVSNRMVTLDGVSVSWRFDEKAEALMRKSALESSHVETDAA